MDTRSVDAAPLRTSLGAIAERILAAQGMDAHRIATGIVEISKQEKIDADFINNLIDRLFDRDGVSAVRLASEIVEDARSGELNRGITISPQLREKIRMIFFNPKRPALMHYNIGEEIHSYLDKLFGRNKWTLGEFGLDQQRRMSPENGD